MKLLSLEPDESMRWIYDQQHPDYNSAMARNLRARREQAILNAPKWMIEEARLNDTMRKLRSAPKIAEHQVFLDGSASA